MPTLSMAVIVVITAMALHLRKETRTGFRFELPTGEMPRPVFITVNILLYAYCLTTLILSFTNHDLAVYFAWVLGVGMLLNGAGHIGIMVWRRGYFPGGISAFLVAGAAGVSLRGAGAPLTIAV